MAAIKFLPLWAEFSKVSKPAINRCELPRAVWKKQDNSKMQYTQPKYLSGLSCYVSRINIGLLCIASTRPETTIAREIPQWLHAAYMHMLNAIDQQSQQSMNDSYFFSFCILQLVHVGLERQLRAINYPQLMTICTSMQTRWKQWMSRRAVHTQARRVICLQT